MSGSYGTSIGRRRYCGGKNQERCGLRRETKILVLHQMVNVRKRINCIGRICTGYGFTENPSEVEEIAKHFELLYCEPFPRPTLGGVEFPSISSYRTEWLEREFKEEEIFLAMSECGGDNASNPDGFNFSFFVQQGAA